MKELSGARRRDGVLVGITMLALTLTACGGGSTAGTAAPATTVSTSATSTSASQTSAATSTSTSSSDSTTSESMSASDTSAMTSLSTTTDSTTESTTESSTTASSTSESESTDSTTGSSSTESTTERSTPSSTAFSTSSGKAAALTKAGTRVKIGQSVVVEFARGQKTASYYQHGTMSVTVTKIVKQSPSIFEKLKNRDEFAGYTPYYIFSTNKILSIESKTQSPPTSPLLDGVLKDGTEAGSIIGLGSLKGCEDDYFDDPEAGAQSINCTVALAKNTGPQVVGVAFEGSYDVYPKSSDNPYRKNPILWLP